VRLSRKLWISIALLAVTTAPAVSTEIAILRNGFSIRYQHRDAHEDVTRLYLSGADDSYIDVPSYQILEFAKDDEDDRPARVEEQPPKTTLGEMIIAASKRNGVDPDLVRSLIQAESGFNSKAISPKGAQGLMQLMPATAVRLGIENPMDPLANVDGGTRYIRELLNRYDNDVIRALAAYNAGPDRVEQFHGVPPFRETQVYISRIISEFNRKKFAQSRTREGRSSSMRPSRPPKSSTSNSSPGISAATKMQAYHEDETIAP
jgi:hypothetical protein